MSNVQSAAERAGIPFEKRCEMAKEHLRETWKLVQEMASSSLRSQQGHSENAAKLEPLLQRIDDRHERETGIALAQAFDEFWKEFAEAEQAYFKKAWDRGIASSRDLFGSDATDFALKALKRDLSGN